MPSEGEILELLFVTHVPNLEVAEEVAVHTAAAAPNVWTGGWLRGLSTIREFKRHLILLPHTKSPGMEVGPAA